MILGIYSNDDDSDTESIIKYNELIKRTKYTRHVKNQITRVIISLIIWYIIIKSIYKKIKWYPGLAKQEEACHYL